MVERVRRAHGAEERETTFYFTSLDPSEASADRLLRLVLARWLIEKQVHHARRVARARVGCAPSTRRRYGPGAERDLRTAARGIELRGTSPRSRKKPSNSLLSAYSAYFERGVQ